MPVTEGLRHPVKRLGIGLAAGHILHQVIGGIERILLEQIAAEAADVTDFQNHPAGKFALHRQIHAVVVARMDEGIETALHLQAEGLRCRSAGHIRDRLGRWRWDRHGVAVHADAKGVEREWSWNSYRLTDATAEERSTASVDVKQAPGGQRQGNLVDVADAFIDDRIAGANNGLVVAENCS